MMSWRFVAIVWGVALAIFLALALLVGCTGPRGAASQSVSPRTDEPAPSTTPVPAVASEEEDDASLREASFASLMAEATQVLECRVGRAWESIARWNRVVEFNCEGFSVVQIFVWTTGRGWYYSELYAPLDLPPSPRPQTRNNFRSPAIEGQRVELRQIVSGNRAAFERAAGPRE